MTTANGRTFTSDPVIDPPAAIPPALALAGTIGGQKITARLHRIGESKFRLLSRGFHWISERPFSR